MGAEGTEAIAAASELAGMSVLAAAERLRRDWDPGLAAAALQQVELRARAAGKFGEAAGGLFLTREGLEQATRSEVSRWRAGRLRDRGVTRIADLGCGLGGDALAAADAGLEVVAVERDPATAVLAAENLRGHGVTVHPGDVTELADGILGPGTALLADPARRTSRGRTWRVDDFSPPYELIMELLDRHGGVVKFGPGMPYGLLPDWCEATWVSDHADAVEVSVWAPSRAGHRSAVVLPSGDELAATGAAATTVAGPSRHLWEPDPAVARAGAIDTLAEQLGATRLHPDIAYLTGDAPVTTPYATCFEVLDAWPWREKAVRAWVRDNDIGTLEIKKRGIDVDPAALRGRLRLRGSGSATIVITPTPDGAQVLVVRRVAPSGSAGAPA